jgi:hypothetical protein
LPVNAQGRSVKIQGVIKSRQAGAPLPATTINAMCNQTRQKNQLALLPAGKFIRGAAGHGGEK